MVNTILNYVWCVVMVFDNPKMEQVKYLDPTHLEIWTTEDGVFTPKQVVWDILQFNLEPYNEVFLFFCLVFNSTSLLWSSYPLNNSKVKLPQNVVLYFN